MPCFSSIHGVCCRFLSYYRSPRTHLGALEYSNQAEILRIIITVHITTTVIVVIVIFFHRLRKSALDSARAAEVSIRRQNVRNETLHGAVFSYLQLLLINNQLLVLLVPVIVVVVVVVVGLW